MVDIIAVALLRNQDEVSAMRLHLANSGAVLVRSCASVLAVTITRVSGQVSSAHLTSMPISADLPMPWPDARAMRNGWNRAAGLDR